VVGARSKSAVAVCALLLALAIVVGTRPAGAETSRVEADVRTLLGLLSFDDMAREVMAAVRPRFDQTLRANMPKLPPGAREVFMDELSQHFAREGGKVADAMVPLYLSEFSHEEIRTLIAFCRTSAGRKFVERAPLLSRKSMEAGMAWGRKIAEGAARSAMRKLADQGYDVNSFR
jgi:hypothetical protein